MENAAPGMGPVSSADTTPWDRASGPMARAQFAILFEERFQIT